MPIMNTDDQMKGGKKIEVTLQYTKMDRSPGAIPWIGVVKATRIANR